MGKEEARSLAAFWKTRLEYEPSCLWSNGEADHVSGTKFNHVASSFSGDISKKIINMCKENLESINVFLLSGILFLLQKHSNNQNISVYLPVKNEDYSKTNINNLLVVGIPNTPKISFREHLLAVKQEYLAIYSHCNYDIIQHLQEKGFWHKNNLIVCLNDFNQIAANELKEMLTLVTFNIEHECIGIEIRYDRSQYNERFIMYFEQHLEKFFQTVVQNPNVLLDDIEVITDEEIETIETYNDTDYPLENSSIASIFEQKVKQIPNKIAAIYHQETITYRQLDTKSNQLAKLLLAYGIKNDDIIAVLLPRSIDVAIAMFGIIKSGGAFVPVDAKYPQERINYILENSKAKLIITYREFSDQLKNIDTICLDEIAFANDYVECTTAMVKSGDLVYLIHTSGSTGNPKGVMIEHRSLINLFEYTTRMINYGQDDTILSVTTISFDMFIFESILSFLKGMTVVFCTEKEVNDPGRIAALIEMHKISVIQTTPSRLKQWINHELFINASKKLKVVILAGEPLSEGLLTKMKGSINGSIINSYGPSETIHVSFKEVSSSKRITIGAPISNVKFHVVDRHDKRSPIGIPGELLISGAAVARGYIYNEKLTNEKFVTCPFDPAGSKMYRTGDYVMWNFDGEIEILGRIDNQVKIRGYRIEVEEVEEVIQSYPGIEEVGVLVKTDQGGNHYLDAVMFSTVPIDIIGLKEWLSQKLPVYMIPANFYQVDFMPHTLNMKIDRKKLATMVKKQLEVSDNVKPTNEVEWIICEQWCRQLNRTSLGINDNFFNLGGDSLQAVQLTSRLMADFEMDPNAIFTYPTIAELAKHVRYRKNGIEEYIDIQKNFAKNLTTASDYKGGGLNKREQYNKLVNNCMTLDLTDEDKRKTVLLTGATGFLGIHLLRDLIVNTDSIVYVLVREKDGFSPQKRVEHNYLHYFTDHLIEDHQYRIIVIKGDIELKSLGLTENDYRELSTCIDTIIHAAANVNHYGVYQEFQLTNVQGTSNLLQFAQTNTVKEFNYISTVGTGLSIPDDYQKRSYTEVDYRSEEQINIDNLYIKSKNQAEELVREAGNNGLPYKIFRCGALFQNSDTNGKPKTYRDLALYQVLTAFYKLKLLPDMDEELYDFSFVNEASKAIIMLFNKNTLRDQTFHIKNDYIVTLHDVFKIFQEHGFTGEGKTITDFFDEVLKKQKKGENIEQIITLLMFFHITNFYTKIESTYTNTLLKKLGHSWTKLSAKDLDFLLDESAVS